MKCDRRCGNRLIEALYRTERQAGEDDAGNTQRNQGTFAWYQILVPFPLSTIMVLSVLSLANRDDALYHKLANMSKFVLRT